MAIYAPIDSDGNEVVLRGDMTANARTGKTELQRSALSACRLTRFDSKEQHKRFRKLEEQTFGNREPGLLFRAWMKHCIAEARRNRYSMDELFAAIEDYKTRGIWCNTHRDQIIEDTKKEIYKEAGVKFVKPANLHPVTKRRIPDEVETVIAKLEGLLKVNVRRTVPNLDTARKIANDIAENGRTIDAWYAWFEQDQWRLDHTEIFANLGKVWESWPRAFVEDAPAPVEGERKSSFYA
jgi:hypothetical protein